MAWRMTWRMVMSFYAMLRWDEVSQLRRSDVWFEGDNMKVNIKRSKTDQFGRGATVDVQGQGVAALSCPVHLTKEYFKRLGLGTDETGSRRTGGCTPVWIQRGRTRGASSSWGTTPPSRT